MCYLLNAERYVSILVITTKYSKLGMKCNLWLTCVQHLSSTGKLFIFRQILLLGVSFRIHLSIALLNKGIVQFLRKPFWPLLGRLLYKLYDLKSSF